MNTVVSALRTHRITLSVWAVILLTLTGVVLHDRAEQAQQMAALSSPNAAVREAMVKRLTRNGSLGDVLTSTEDPASDATSPQNVKSAALRENAAAAVKSLSDAGQVSASDAMNTLFPLCKDADATVKAAAEAGLKDLGEKSDANLAAIAARLKDGDPEISSAAADVLGLVGTDPGFGDKTARLANAVMSDTSAQASAESALQKIGGPAEPYLSAYLNDPTTTVDFRSNIVSILGQIGTPNTLAPLTQQAHSDQPALKREAIVSLADVVLATDAAWRKAAAGPKPDPASVQKLRAAFTQASASEPLLIAALQDTNGDSEMRSQATLALGDVGGQTAARALIVALGDYDTQVRLAAVSALQSSGSPSVGLLTAALERGGGQARASAAEALGGIGTGPAVAALVRALADPATPARVRRGAAVGLGRSGSPAAIPALVRALGDSQGGVETAASDALLSPPLMASAVGPLVASFTQPTPVPFNASRILSRMGEQAVPDLLQATRAADPQTQTWAAVTLGETGSKRASVLPALTALTASANPQVQFAAKSALDQLRPGMMGS